MIWAWKARSVEQARQRSVGGWARERRRTETGDVGDVEREGGSEVVGDEEEEADWGDSEVRRRRKGMRSDGRR
jgi:hypothetical protein